MIGRDVRACRGPLDGLTALGLPTATQAGPPASRVTSDPRGRLTEGRAGAESSNGSTAVLFRNHSAGYWNWQYRVAKRQSRNAVRYARKLERLIRARRHHRASARTLSGSSAGGSVENAICVTFGSYCSQAVTVARCESGLNVSAANGQYLGLFQMGEYARARYGHSWDAWSQARAAYRYFRDSGYSWEPWQCQP